MLGNSGEHWWYSAEETETITKFVSSRSRVTETGLVCGGLSGKCNTGPYDLWLSSVCGFAPRTVQITNRSQLCISFSLTSLSTFGLLPHLADAHLFWWQISLSLLGAGPAQCTTASTFPAQMPFVNSPIHPTHGRNRPMLMLINASPTLVSFQQSNLFSSNRPVHELCGEGGERKGVWLNNNKKPRISYLIICLVSICATSSFSPFYLVLVGFFFSS